MANGASQYCGLPNLDGLVLFDSAQPAPLGVAGPATIVGTAFGPIFGGNNASPSLGEYQSGAFLLDVTAAAAAAGDTLDVFIQTTFDAVPTAGGVWVDVVHFAQLIGTGGAKKFADKITVNVAQAEFENSAAFAASSVRHIFGDVFRVKYAIVDGGAHGQSFTFSVSSNWK